VASGAVPLRPSLPGGVAALLFIFRSECRPNPITCPIARLPSPSRAALLFLFLIDKSVSSFRKSSILFLVIALGIFWRHPKLLVFRLLSPAFIWPKTPGWAMACVIPFSFLFVIIISRFGDDCSSLRPFPLVYAPVDFRYSFRFTPAYYAPPDSFRFCRRCCCCLCFLINCMNSGGGSR